ncbi:gentisate 1,2-dioxygenase [Comamonas sp. BIGb0124]|uniref:cupin domain-containing protein n=1 Tax=Comamonas sp. BIGb0124 TaxID=2485130 RepID=UPI000F4799C5|nr:cupin domain-containing protein [Comamonas sp. BIGb0124]ROR23097.1 gentisate 1,2-dioxygenase [Comamonas sp. BIGb0124]
MCSGNEAGAIDARPLMSSLGAQRAIAPANAAQAQARYFNSANAFNVKLPVVPAHAFDDVAAAALGSGQTTGWHVCDQSAALGSPSAATTPFMLARYAHIRQGQTLDAQFLASGVLCFVIAGEGWSRTPRETLNWQAGDLMFFAGGQPLVLGALSSQAVLWVVTDEPLYAFTKARPSTQPEEMLPTVQFKAGDIRHQLDLIHASRPDEGTSGLAVVFSSEALQDGRNILPTLTLSLNSLPPRTDQSAHRHNSAALTLVVEGENCHTRIDGQAVGWQPWSTLVTPAAAAHSHHNAGNTRALFLIVQDGGLYYQGRTMGFEFLG